MEPTELTEPMEFTQSARSFGRPSIHPPMPCVRQRHVRRGAGARPRMSVLFVLPLLLLVAGSACPAYGVSKEMIQLQTQVQELQEMLQHLQQSNDERMGV